jgi:hypothetical protein
VTRFSKKGSCHYFARYVFFLTKVMMLSKAAAFLRLVALEVYGDVMLLL